MVEVDFRIYPPYIQIHTCVKESKWIWNFGLFKGENILTNFWRATCSNILTVVT